ncbi:MAG: bifunctional nicotinamidase/pyrazinamidase [Bacteroidota bacterium]
MEALIIVDVQNDFVPGGALAVPEGDQVVDLINELSEKFDLVVATQDWHPADHGSFAANNEGTAPGQVIELNGLPQVLWPVHCVQGSGGAEFVKSLNLDSVARIFQKGTDSGIDSYSGFFDNGHLKATGLGDYLQEKGVKTVYVTGLATDYCVKFTALDAQKLGFTTFVITDACRAVNLSPEDESKALTEMEAAGIGLLEHQEFMLS